MSYQNMEEDLRYEEVAMRARELTPHKVNHIEPSHYTDMKISPLEYIEANQHLTWSLANAIKYISRAGKKDNNPILQDLKKAQWYLNHEIERLES